MAWSTPRLWVAGELVTAAIMNTYVSDDLAALRAGGIAIASQATGDFLFASSSTQLGRLATPGAYQSIRRNSGASAYEAWFPWRPRVTTAASASSVNVDTATTDVVEFTALAANLTINTFTGADAERILFRIKDNGTPRTLTWTSQWSPGGIALPTITVASKWMHLCFIHKSAISVFLVGAAQEA
jgi:hypothetical protein